MDEPKTVHGLRLPAWEPCAPRVTCGSLCRSGMHYSLIVGQFDVEANPRYQARNGETWCNIFAWDVTRAMGCEVPHWIRGRETTANDVANWLANEGTTTYGWARCDALGAAAHANRGEPTLAVWRNPVPGPGHIAAVVPAPDSALAIAQAGARNFAFGTLQHGFGLLVPDYFWHE